MRWVVRWSAGPRETDMRRCAQKFAGAVPHLDLAELGWTRRTVVPASLGKHDPILDKAAEIMRTGVNPDAVPFEEVKAMINRRLGQ
jgi:hypothetical protein